MSDRIVVATRKGLFFLDRGGRRGWKIGRVAFLADNASMALPDSRDGAVYVALGHGHFGVKLHRSTDGGKKWQEITTPAFPPKPDGEEPWRDPMGREIPASVQLIWSLEPGGRAEDGVLWCGTIPGGLFRSRDHGKSWDLVTGLWNHPKRREWTGGGADYPGIHSVCVDPNDPRRVAVGISCGGVWVTGDGGTSWDCRAKGMWAAYMPPERKDDPNVQDPHRVVQCPADTRSFWAQHHNGVFRSTDGAASWQEVKTVKPSTFGFAVAVHPGDPNTAWFVPGVSDEKRIPAQGRVVVARTRDGGQTFDVLTKGLPQRHAYDLTFRHGLDIDETGDCLAFGTTTGSLWVSENQGDSWVAISEHLPPVYCVRFVRT
ncbi:MAG: exo-alpha-sialidase [Gemmatimonadetes bacterium]|nr:exo-alpha-sialidase [Gemmatimonadota bacterium]